MKKISCLLILFLIPLFSFDKAPKPPQRFQITRSYLLSNSSKDTPIQFKLSAPDVTSYHNTKVLKSAYSIEPSVKKDLPNGMVRLTFDVVLKPLEEKILTLTWDVELSDMNFLTTPGKEILSPELKAGYLKADKLIESDNPEIIKAAAEITAGKATDLEKAQAIFDFVRGYLKYVRSPQNVHGALQAYQNKIGDCTEFSCLTAALGRAAKIPSRMNGVMFMKADTGKSAYDNHDNAEFYLEGLGWIPAEGTFKTAQLGNAYNFEAVFRRGLKTDEGIDWFGYNIKSAHNKFKTIKLMGHTWRKLE
jgi:transglutaminase-like putative cysteine protease